PYSTQLSTLSLHDALPIWRRIETLCDAARQRLRDGEAASAREVDCYQSLALYLLYCNVGETMDRAIDEVMRSPVESDGGTGRQRDRKSTRLNSSHEWISYA